MQDSVDSRHARSHALQPQDPSPRSCTGTDFAEAAKEPKPNLMRRRNPASCTKHSKNFHTWGSRIMYFIYIYTYRERERVFFFFFFFFFFLFLFFFFLGMSDGQSRHKQTNSAPHCLTGGHPVPPRGTSSSPSTWRELLSSTGRRISLQTKEYTQYPGPICPT